jgi:hypothetical protein
MMALPPQPMVFAPPLGHLEPDKVRALKLDADGSARWGAQSRPTCRAHP